MISLGGERGLWVSVYHYCRHMCPPCGVRREGRREGIYEWKGWNIKGLSGSWFAYKQKGMGVQHCMVMNVPVLVVGIVESHGVESPWPLGAFP